MPELRAKFTADDTDFQRKLGQAERGVSRFGSLAQGIEGRMAGMFGAAAIGQFARTVMEAAESVSAISDSTGLSPRFVQSFMALGEGRGVAEKTEQAINKLSSARLEALSDRSSNAAKNLRALGISSQELRSLSMDDYIVRVAEGMASAEGNARKMAAGSELVGVRSTKMIAVLKDLAAMGKQGLETKFAPDVMSEKTIENIDKLDQLNDKIKRRAVSRFGGMLGQAGQAVGALGVENIMRAAEQSLPAGLGAVVGGMGLSSDIQASKSGSPIAGMDAPVMKLLSEANRLLAKIADDSTKGIKP